MFIILAQWSIPIEFRISDIEAWDWGKAFSEVGLCACVLCSLAFLYIWLQVLRNNVEATVEELADVVSEMCTYDDERTIKIDRDIKFLRLIAIGPIDEVAFPYDAMSCAFCSYLSYRFFD